MKEQFRRWGILYDWDKELASCDPAYYRWNQWFFNRMLEKGLAYRGRSPVNWCSSCQTVLANEQVKDGACERCQTPVQQRELEQWFLRITAYADRLLEGLDRLPDWSEKVKTMQRNWIGRSEGCDVVFRLEGTDEPITIFTTRVDTIYGATFMAIAPEHPLVDRFRATAPDADFGEFVDRLRNQSRLQRESEGGDKEGRFTGAYAVNPFSGERLPIWVANFVLMEYGTGAIMSVPAHDERDFAFATKFGIPIRVVIAGPGMDASTVLTEAYSGPGSVVNSGPVRRAVQRREQDEDGDLRRGAGVREAHRALPPARLADLEAALLGDADPGGLLRPRRDRPGARRPAPGGVADRHPVRRRGREPSRPQRELHGGHLPALRRTRPARDGHHGHLRGLVLVLRALRQPPRARPHARRGTGEGVDAGGSLHRRHRARHPPPHVRPLLLQGAVRLRDGA